MQITKTIQTLPLSFKGVQKQEQTTETQTQISSASKLAMPNKAHFAGVFFTGAAAEELAPYHNTNKTAKAASDDMLSSIEASGGEIKRLDKKGLIKEFKASGEGEVHNSGAIVFQTNVKERTPKARFFVLSDNTDSINWKSPNNQQTSQATFDKIYDKMKDHLEAKKVFVFDGFVGADPQFRGHVRFINTSPGQNLFVQNMFIKPKNNEEKNRLEKAAPNFTVVVAPDLKLDKEKDGLNNEAGVLVNIDKGIVLIAGTKFSGEMKKSIFTLMNFLLPEKNVFPMHCSAVELPAEKKGEKDSTAVLFGLSGTGKTTLSADKGMKLLGDDEHGWSEKGIFNLEGGCYAKAIGLDPKKEPVIWDATHQEGTVIENVPVRKGELNFKHDPDDETSADLNCRSAYSRSSLPADQLKESNMAKHPNAVIFLSADANGVLPPIAKLTPEQAKYYFLSGYTSKMPGTETGAKGQPTFSVGFGEPFLPRHPSDYANMLADKIENHGASVYLVNTGYVGASLADGGKRMDIDATRALVRAAIKGGFDKSSENWEKHPIFGFEVPKTAPGLTERQLHPQWKDQDAYNLAAKELAYKFRANFNRFYTGNEEKDAEMARIAKAGPQG